MKQQTIWIMTGESSGDFYGAEIAKAIFKQRPGTIICGMGSHHMRDAGVDLFVDSSELGVMGFIEVFALLGTFVRLYFDCIRRAKEERPDIVLMIDYPGFNMRLGKQLAKLGIPVVWYISPQVWAWRKSNIPKFAAFCKRMMVIFPFEPDVWKNSGLDVIFTGHPLIEIVKQRTDSTLQRDPNRLLILPGSRHGETSRLLVPFLQTALILHRRHPALKFAIATPREKVFNDVQAIVAEFRKNHPELNELTLEISCHDTARQQQLCIAGLAASGTVTVESAIADLPLVSAYRLNPVTFVLAVILIRKLFRNAFTMVNIILNRKTFEEFLQMQVRPQALANAVDRILPGGSRREEVMRDMAELRRELTCGSESATVNAANALLEVLDKTTTSPA